MKWLANPDGQGYRNQREDYITARFKAESTHSICPDCAKKLYPEFYSDKNLEQENSVGLAKSRTPLFWGQELPVIACH